MTQIAVRSEPVPINLQVGYALGLSDQELFRLCAQNPEGGPVTAPGLLDRNPDNRREGD